MVFVLAAFRIGNEQTLHEVLIILKISVTAFFSLFLSLHLDLPQLSSRLFSSPLRHYIDHRHSVIS